MTTSDRATAGSRRNPPLLDIAALAEQLGVTERNVRRLVHDRAVPYIKWRRLIRFDPEEIAAWLDAARYPSRGPGDAA